MLLSEVMAAMRIQGNWISLMSWRAFSKSSSDMSGSLARLSSGLRINTASDDVAGLAVSESLMAQYRGLIQATRNALDGISLVNTAEGALQEINSMLLRARELTLQAANGVLTPDGRVSIQTEIDNILTEIDRITDTTAFNGRLLLNGTGSGAVIGKVLNGLRSGWLEKAADVIRTQYGLVGDGATITVQLEAKGSSAAWISGTPGLNGVLDNVKLHLNLEAFGLSATSPVGAEIADDRKVARALTLATLSRAADYFNLDAWFRSGVADLIAGRDEQLRADIQLYGLSNIVDALSTPWQDDSIHQSAAYVAIKYLDAQLGLGGMKALMNELSLTGNALDLDDAFTNTLGIGLGAFLGDFAANGATWAAANLDLADADVGAIQTGDNSSVIPDDGTYKEEPLAPGFAVAWSGSGILDPVKIDLHVGPTVQDRISFLIPNVSTLALGLVGLNVTHRASEAIDKVTGAVNTLSSIRAELGAITNRLEVTVNANRNQAEASLSSFSRIRDLDFAKELSGLTRQQILLSSSGAMLAQANSMRQNVKWLLNGMAPAGRAGGTGVAFASM